MKALLSPSLLRTLIAFAMLIGSASAFADAIRPAYLGLTEEKPGEFSVLWKIPMLGDARLPVEPEFSGDAKAATPVTTRTPPGAAIEQWTLRAPALRGQTLRESQAWTVRKRTCSSASNLPTGQNGCSG